MLRHRHLPLAGDPRRYALAILVNAFGGGMSSRLFQRVREELGLAYAVYAYQPVPPVGTGQLGRLRRHPARTRADAGARTRSATELRAAGARRARRRRSWRRGKRQLQGAGDAVAGEPGGRMNRLAHAGAAAGSRIARSTRVLGEIDAVTARTRRGGGGGVLRPGAADGAVLGPRP